MQPVFEHVGYIEPSLLPGLGIEFNEDAAQEYPFRPYHIDPVARRDGSLNNW